MSRYTLTTHAYLHRKTQHTQDIMYKLAIVIFSHLHEIVNMLMASSKSGTISLLVDDIMYAVTAHISYTHTQREGYIQMHVYTYIHLCICILSSLDIYTVHSMVVIKQWRKLMVLLNYVAVSKLEICLHTYTMLKRALQTEVVAYIIICLYMH